MFEVDVKANEDVIVQGDVGDKFYVMNGGKVQVIIDGKQVAELTGQNSFGELALIYGTPRAATIRACEDMKLYAMDGITYKCMVMGSVQKKRALFEGVLAKVTILADLDSWERSQVADALESENFADGAARRPSRRPRPPLTGAQARRLLSRGTPATSSTSSPTGRASSTRPTMRARRARWPNWAPPTFSARLRC